MTINSDDPAYFGGYVGDNFTALQEQADLDIDTATRLAHNSITASFASAERKAELEVELAAWVRASPQQ